MGRADLIGNSKKHLVPAFQPAVMASIKQSDGTVFRAKPLPKAFNNFKNAAYTSGSKQDPAFKSAPFRKSPVKKAR
jgi:hypothetical protein